MTRAPNSLVSAVHKEIDDLAPGCVVVVACSGGADSMALAAATLQCLPQASVVIVDHGMQPGSAQIAARAAETCANLGYSRVDVVEVNPKGHGGPEAQARRARYTALREQAAQQNAGAVLLGHTMDDQAETVLLGLTRGSGPRALAGMPRRRGVFRRPFLGLRRKEVRSTYPDVPVWEDPHNADRRFRRTVVRHEVLPALIGELGDSVVPALARSADLVRTESEAVDHWAAELVDQHLVVANPVAVTSPDAVANPDAVTSPVVVACAPLRAVPRAVVARVMIAAAEHAGCRRGDLSSVHVTALTDLVLRWRGQGQVDLPGSVIATRVSGTVEFCHRGRIR